MTASDPIEEYLLKLMRERDERITGLITALSEREQQLVREAAVAAFVHGVMHAGSILGIAIPPDTVVMRLAFETALAMPDRYPTLSAGSGNS